MPTLHRLQETFMQAIYHHGDSPLANLAVYRRSVFGGLQKALNDIYPVSRKLVGREFFEAMCLRYISITPSQSADINDYGHHLAAFTEHFTPARALPYLPDVMRLEWAWHRALQVNDYPALSLEGLMHLDERQLAKTRLVMTPTASLVSSRYPILTIWQVNQDDYPGEQAVQLDQGGQRLLVWRHNDELLIETLSAKHWSYLSLLSSQVTLESLEQVDEKHTCLVEVLEKGLIVDYATRDLGD